MRALNVVGNILATILFIPIGIVCAVAVAAVLLVLLVIAIPVRMIYSLWTGEPFLGDNLF